MHRQVSESARTPYSAGDLASLFHVGRETMKKLVQLMPRTAQGNAAVVEREHLLAWLNSAMDAEDLSAHLQQLRKDPPRPSRRKLRVFVPRDGARVELQSLKTHLIWLKRGKLEMDYTTLDDFWAKMLLLAHAAAEADFERRFCDPPAPQQRTPLQQAEDEDLTYLRQHRKLCRVADAMAMASACGDRSRARRLQKIEAAIYARLEAFCASTGRELDEVTVTAHRLLQGEDVALPLPQTSSPETSD